MKITKKEIEFFKSYVLNEENDSRAVLKHLFLDLSDIRTEKFDKEEKERRYGKLVATNGFCVGSLEVELSDEDKDSYLIPYEHLAVAKSYLKTKSTNRFWKKVIDNVEVVRDAKNIYFKTKKATITVEVIELDKFPEYKRVMPKGEGEYAVKVGVNLLTDILASFKKMGMDHVLLRMNGNDKPIGFESLRNDIVSILMPVRVEDEKMGKLQKIDKK